VRLYYLDESEGLKYYVRSAIGVNVEVWSEVFGHVRNWRKEIMSTYHIPLFKELHAYDLLHGKGNVVRRGKAYIRPSKESGVKIFRSGLTLIETIGQLFPNQFEVINVSIEKSYYPKIDMITLERMQNRINKSVEQEDKYAFLIFDEGKEANTTRVYRKALVYNPIPSKFQLWEDGQEWKNIPPQNIVGGPAFRNSSSDYFIQLADFVAHALLKKDEQPTERVIQYKINEVFDILDLVLNRKASEEDPQGVVRY
jgi:hypothetical protein